MPVCEMMFVYKYSLFFMFSEEYNDMGRLIRSCSGEVSVNKCEGMCSSQVQPSVSTATGFLKVV